MEFKLSEEITHMKLSTLVKSMIFNSFFKNAMTNAVFELDDLAVRVKKITKVYSKVVWPEGQID